MATSNVDNGVEELVDLFNHALYVLLNFPVGKRDYFKSLVKRNVVSDYTKNVVRDLVSQLSSRFGIHIETKCVFCALEEAHNFLSLRFEARSDTVSNIDPCGVGASSFPGNILLRYLDKRFFKDKFPSSKLVFIGSVGDGTFLPEWSDIDCLLFLGTKEVNCQKLKELQTEVVKLRGFLSLIDPMQDHGVFCLSPFSTEHYSQKFMPISVIESGFSYPGGSHVQVVMEDREDAKSKVFSQVVVTPILDNSFGVPMTRGQYRFLLHRIFLMPTLFYQARGVYLTKPSGLLAIRRDKEHIDWRFLDVASDKRYSWSGPRHYRFFASFFVGLVPFLMCEMLRWIYGHKRLSSDEAVEAKKLFLSYKSAVLQLNNEV